MSENALTSITAAAVSRAADAAEFDDAGLGVEEIAALFEVAGSEDSAVRGLDDNVARLHVAQRAKAELRQVSPTQLRAGLELRALLRGATA